MDTCKMQVMHKFVLVKKNLLGLPWKINVVYFWVINVDRF
jgi:hypothetical protein